MQSFGQLLRAVKAIWLKHTVNGCWNHSATFTLYTTVNGTVAWQPPCAFVMWLGYLPYL